MQVRGFVQRCENFVQSVNLLHGRDDWKLECLLLDLLAEALRVVQLYDFS